MSATQLAALLAPYQAKSVCVMRYTRVVYLDRALRPYGAK